MFDNFEEIARNLLSLEINTLVSGGMTAEKMPVAPRALIQVAQTYQEYLCGWIKDCEAAGPGVPGVPDVVAQAGTNRFADWEVRTGGSNTFALLRQVARACQAARDTLHPGVMLRPGDEAVLARIVSSCDQIYGVFIAAGVPDVKIDATSVRLAEEEQNPPPAMSRDALVTLRKIWELGTDTVVMQTTVQIDGDVIVRVLEGWQGSEFAALHDLHRQAVDVSMQRWGFLVQTVRDLIGFFLGTDLRPNTVSTPGGAGAGGSAGNTPAVATH